MLRSSARRFVRRVVVNGPLLRTARSSSMSTAAHGPAAAGTGSGAASPGQAAANPSALPTPAAKQPAKPKRFRYFMMVAAPLAAYWWYQRSIRKSVAENSETSVSATQKEIKDLLQRCNLSISDLERLGDHLERSVPGGRLGVEDFSKYVYDYVAAQKNMVAAERERKKKSKEDSALQASIDELQTLKASGMTIEQWVDQQMAAEEKVRAELKLQGKELPADVERKQAAEDAKSEQLDDKARRAKHARERFDSWDMLCLLRATRLDARGLAEVSEMLAALGLLSFDKKPEEEVIIDPDAHQATLEQKNVNSFTKLAFAWRAVDRDRDGVLSYQDFVRLMSHLLHTGHVDPSSILVRTSVWPPQFRLSTAQELAESVYRDMGLTPGSSPIRLTDFAAAAEAMARSNGSRPSIWYLQPEWWGFFRTRREKYFEEARRLYRTQSLGAPLAGVAAEREQARLAHIEKVKADRAKLAEKLAKKKADEEAKAAKAASAQPVGAR